MNATKPTHRIRRGRLEVAIWENDSKNGIFYRAKFSRSFRDGEGKLQNSSSFSRPELAELALLAIQAEDWMRTTERSKNPEGAEPAEETSEAAAA